MEPTMDTDPDPYDADGFYAGTDFLSGYDQAGAPTAHSPGIHSSELSNLLSAAGASNVRRARSLQQLRQGSDEAPQNNHQFNEADPMDLEFDQSFLDSDSCDEADPNDHEFNEYSNNFQFDEPYLNNPQFNEADLDDHPANEAGPHNRHLVDAVANTEEADTLDDQLPHFKRRKTKNTESSHMALAQERTPSTTSAARTSIASVLTDRSSRFSASTARSSVISMSTARSSVGSMLSPSALADQTGEDGAFKWKCLMCNMGEGDSRKAYVRKEGNTPGEQGSAGTPESSNKRAPRPKNSWNTQTLLEKHIRETHIIMFERTNSSEYICIFCPCGDVMKQSCEGRFLTKALLLNHVSTAHHEIPERRVKYHHWCAPRDSRSYPQKLLDKFTRKDGSTSTSN